MLAIVLLSAGLAARAALTPPYAALVAQVTAGGDDDRRVFARVALEQMAASYEAEAARGRHADARWRSFMQQEAAVLRSRAARIGEAGRITIAQDGPDGVRLIIDSENVIVASPRLDAPERLEASIVGEACLYLPCATPLPVGDGTVAAGAGDAFGPADAPAERTWPRLAVQGAGLPPGQWFHLESGGGTYRTANGLNFQFKEPAGRQESLAALCERVSTDLERLAAALAHARAERWPLVWEYLRLGPLLEGEQSVVINPLGDAFLLPLQEAAIVGRLLPASVVWLQRRAGGEGSQQYFPEADRLLVLAAEAPTGATGGAAAPSAATASSTTGTTGTGTGGVSLAGRPAASGLVEAAARTGIGAPGATTRGAGGTGSFPATAPARLPDGEAIDTTAPAGPADSEASDTTAPPRPADGEAIDTSAPSLPPGWRPL